MTRVWLRLQDVTWDPGNLTPKGWNTRGGISSILLSWEGLEMELQAKVLQGRTMKLVCFLTKGKKAVFSNILDSYLHRWANFLEPCQQVPWLILSAKENKIVPKLRNGQTVFCNLFLSLIRLSGLAGTQPCSCLLSHPAPGQQRSPRLAGLKSSWGPVDGLRGNADTHLNLYFCK